MQRAAAATHRSSVCGRLAGIFPKYGDEVGVRVEGTDLVTNGRFLGFTDNRRLTEALVLIGPKMSITILTKQLFVLLTDGRRRR